MTSPHRGDRRLPSAVWVAAGAVVAALLAVAPRYGWHRDELYFLAAGRHLDWGYIDQPPFTPLVARLADEVAPGNLVVLRLLPALAVAGAVVAGALIARELGGGRRAQVLASAALASGGFLLGVGHLLATAAFDLTAWTVLIWIWLRLLRTGDHRLWMVFGAVAGASLLNKHLVVMLVLAVGVGTVAGGRKRALMTPWLAVGAAIALVIASPNLVWQAQNGWPQLDMAGALSERLAAESRVTLLPSQLLFLGPPLVPLLWWGSRWLWRDLLGHRFRPLLLAWLTGLVLTFASGGRPYYVLPLTLAVAVAGIVAVEGRTRMVRALPWLIAANGLVCALLALPVAPRRYANVAASVNEAVAETVGWPELVDQVAQVAATLPPEDRARMVLVTGSYGEAGAIDRFGPAHGLPPAHSAHNSYADFRRPTDDGATLVAVRYRPEVLAPHFAGCDQVAVVDNGLGVENEVQGAPIVVCRGLRRTWAATWPLLRHLS